MCGAARACPARIRPMQTRYVQEMSDRGQQVRPVWSSPWAVTFSSMESIFSLVIICPYEYSGSGCHDSKEPPSSFWFSCSHGCLSLFALLLCYCLAGGLKLPPCFSSAVFQRQTSDTLSAFIYVRQKSQPLLCRVCHSLNDPSNLFFLLVSFMFLKTRSTSFVVSCPKVLSLPPGKLLVSPSSLVSTVS